MAAPLNPPKDLRPRIAVSPALLGVDITTPSFPAAVDALDPTSGKYLAGGHMPDLPVHPQTAKNHIQLGTITFGKAPKWLIQSASGIPIEGQNRFTTYTTTAFNQMYSMTEKGSVMRMWLEQEVGIFDLEDLDMPKKQYDLLPYAAQQAFWAPRFKPVAAQWFRNALQTLDLQAVLSPGPEYETLKWCFITIVIVAWQQIIGPERDLKYIRIQTANV
ncbi:hypothetical protein LTR97_004256 [Elasticomyces elasticus]|uniref:Uncharacterized protein n=1 Tax=Elasticomyces elasticus TaxID=574655 RepID=A0AAN7ZUB5_9PEZI|nr:hypothetical protein LTR97_004256 [Elasticomyces elasticus]